MDLKIIETELKKRTQYEYKWGRKQSDKYDIKTNFIYNINAFDDLIGKIENDLITEDDYKGLRNYALNRWYNFWSAMAVENIFRNLRGVVPAVNSKDRLVDFSINGINFDHKTSVFPKKYTHEIDYAQQHPKDLIEWLYKNQSQEGRKHHKNRLFIVLYSHSCAHWKLKAEIDWMKSIIENYVSNFDATKPHSFNFTPNSSTLSDIIWGIK